MSELKLIKEIFADVRLSCEIFAKEKDELFAVQRQEYRNRISLLEDQVKMYQASVKRLEEGFAKLPVQHPLVRPNLFDGIPPLIGDKPLPEIDETGHLIFKTHSVLDTPEITQ